MRFSSTATTASKKTSQSPGCSSSLIGQKKFFWPIRSGQFKRFWNWFGKSKCPGARLDLTVNFHHGHFIDPTNCPWVSEDGFCISCGKNKSFVSAILFRNSPLVCALSMSRDDAIKPHIRNKRSAL